MPAFSQNQIEEINAIIKTIESEIKPKMEIGAKDKVVLAGLLQANKIKKSSEDVQMQTGVFRCYRFLLC